MDFFNNPLFAKEIHMKTLPIWVDWLDGIQQVVQLAEYFVQLVEHID